MWLFHPDGDDLPPLEVVAAHRRRRRSSVGHMAVPWSERRSELEPPPSMAWLRSLNTRAVFFWGPAGYSAGHAAPRRGRGRQYVQGCLGGGPHLLSLPLHDFEATSPSWLFAIGASGGPKIYVAGPGDLLGDAGRSAPVAHVGGRCRRAEELPACAPAPTWLVPFAR